MPTLRSAVLIVALANLSYFFVEFTVALNIKAVSLFADSADFLEDASVNLLIFTALAWSTTSRSRMGKVMALILLAPAFAFISSAWQKINLPLPPAPLPLSLTGLGALAVNLSCALLLSAYRDHRGSLTKAAFLSARNDAIANLAIIAAGLVTGYLWNSVWPDLVVGGAIGIMNIDAAKKVWSAADGEMREAP